MKKGQRQIIGGLYIVVIMKLRIVKIILTMVILTIIIVMKNLKESWEANRQGSSKSKADVCCRSVRASLIIIIIVITILVIVIIILVIVIIIIKYFHRHLVCCRQQPFSDLFLRKISDSSWIS